MSLINVDLPDPETPVIHTNTPNGILRSRLFRLFALAPFSVTLGVSLPIDFLGNSNIFFVLDRYGPVTEFGSLNIWSGVPWEIILPPVSPDPGPMSIT